MKVTITIEALNWFSQPLLNGMAAGNLLMACATVFTGLTYTRVKEIMDVLGIVDEFDINEYPKCTEPPVCFLVCGAVQL